MTHPSSTVPFGSPASPPDVAVLVLVLVTVVIAAVLLFRTIHYCLDDLNRRASVTGGDKRFWAAVIILGGPLGQIVYWLYGRGE
jgi:hypothetical protein